MELNIIIFNFLCKLLFCPLLINVYVMVSVIQLLLVLSDNQ